MTKIGSGVKINIKIVLQRKTLKYLYDIGGGGGGGGGQLFADFRLLRSVCRNQTPREKRGVT